MLPGACCLAAEFTATVWIGGALFALQYVSLSQEKVHGNAFLINEGITAVDDDAFFLLLFLLAGCYYNYYYYYCGCCPCTEQLLLLPLH